MSLIEELGELSFVCAGQHERIQELEEAVKDAADLLEKSYCVIENESGLEYAVHEPFLLVIEAWQKRAKQLLGEK